MTINIIADCDCNALPVTGRCDASLPDNPQCAPNYHFGMLLGVDDFRAEQGFHLGHMRRHQRLLHGKGVVAGFDVKFDPTSFELKVYPGYGIDGLGRDLVLAALQCVSLPKWWLAHRGDDAFHDIATPDDATLDLDIMVCYASCLDTPVPAIADPCAGDAADIAYSRICETVTLSLVRTPPAPATPPDPPFHLLRMWRGEVGARTDGAGKPLDSDQWLLDSEQKLEALPQDRQAAARIKLLREVLARAATEVSPEPPAHPDDESDLCLPLARLTGVHLKLDPGGWTASIDDVAMGLRDVLLPTSLLEIFDVIESTPATVAAGPVVASATPTGSEVDLVFSQKLEQASVTPAAFAASEFVTAQGWKPFIVTAAVYDESDPGKPTVRLTLDRAPVAKPIRITVIGEGSAPLLGANLIPAGAVDPDGDGRTSTTIIRG